MIHLQALMIKFEGFQVIYFPPFGHSNTTFPDKMQRGFCLSLERIGNRKQREENLFETPFNSHPLATYFTNQVVDLCGCFMRKFCELFYGRMDLSFIRVVIMFSVLHLLHRVNLPANNNGNAFLVALAEPPRMQA